MKKYKDNGVYDFSDYAEEITGDALFKINGGAEVENSNDGVAGAKPGDTITRKNGDVIVLKQADIDYANAQLENNGNDGTGNGGSSATSGGSGTKESGSSSIGASSGSCGGGGSPSVPSGSSGSSGTGNNSNSESNNTSNSRSTNNSSSGANNTGISNTSTSESTPEVPEEIKQNSNAYAYYMSLQGRAKEEGNPDKYKGYNVLGGESIGLTKLTPFKLLNEVIGQSGTDIWKSVPKHTLSVDGRSGSFPIIGICYDSETMENPLNDVNTFVHEVFHQVQYNENKNAFKQLLGEFLINEKKSRFDNIDNYTYRYDKNNLENYTSLSDLPYLEAQAEFVGDYGSLYYKSRYGNGVNPYEEKTLRQMVEVMKNSGYGDTEAVKWIEN